MTSNVRRLAGGISVAAVAVSLFMAVPASAQASSSTLQGHVDGAAPGTEVVALDTHTGQQRTVTLDADGNYTFLGVRPSSYRVTVAGFDPQETTVLVGDTSTLDFSNNRGDIVVVGGRIREVRSVTVATNVTPAQIANLPQNSRNFLSFAILAPGVNVAPGGTAQLQAGATSSSNTNVMLDGMSFKNPINHGGIFGQNFGIGNPFPQIAIQEYRIDTQNFGAESGQVGSALITAVTKTGGSEFHGTAFAQWQPNSFLEQPYFDRINNVPKPEYNRWQFGGDLGGPIIPGVLTFYLAGEGTVESLPGATGIVTAVPASVASLVNTTRNFDFHQGLYFGKLTWFASPNDTVNLQAFIRRENNLSDIDGNAAATHGRTILTHQDRYQLQWTHNGDGFLNVLNVSYDTSTQSTPAVGTGPEYNLANTFTTLAACTGSGVAANNCSYFAGGPAANSNPAFDARAQLGAHFFYQGDRSRTITIRDDATFLRGEHTIKAGLQFAFLDLQRTVNNSFNGRYYYLNPGTSGTFDPLSDQPFGAQINIQPSPTLKAHDTQFGVYVQDEWKPDEHLTVNLGLRWDLETNANNNRYQTPAAIAAALRAYPGWRARGINPEDYITDGTQRHPEFGAIQPRLGISYDVHGDRDLVFFAGAGRYFDRSLFIEGAIETLTNSNRIINVNFCPNGAAPGAGQTCVQWNNSYRDPNNLRTLATALAAGGGGDVWVLNNQTHLPFSDQFDIGVRKRFGSIQTSLTLSYIRSHNIFQFVRANFYTNGWYSRFLQRDGAGNVIGCTNGGDAWIQDYTPNSTFAACAAGGGQLAGFNGKLDRGMSSGVSDYLALYLQIEKPFTDASTWGFTSSLTVQSARSNVAQELNNDEFFNGARQDAYGWNFVNGLEDWRWVTTANWRAPWGITASGTLVLSSGPRFGNVIFGNAPDGACCYGNFGGPLSPSPFIGYKRLDLRIAKTFELPFGGHHRLTADFQAFNVFNWLNRTYSSWGAGSGSPPPLIENGQVGNDARSFQVGLRYEF